MGRNGRIKSDEELIREPLVKLTFGRLKDEGSFYRGLSHDAIKSSPSRPLGIATEFAGTDARAVFLHRTTTFTNPHFHYTQSAMVSTTSISAASAAAQSANEAALAMDAETRNEEIVSSLRGFLKHQT